MNAVEVAMPRLLAAFHPGGRVYRVGQARVIVGASPVKGRYIVVGDADHAPSDDEVQVALGLVDVKLHEVRTMQKARYFVERSK